MKSHKRSYGKRKLMAFVEEKLRDVLQEREGTSLNYLNYLGLSWTIWDYILCYLGPTRIISDSLGLFWSISDYLRLSVTIWCYLRLSVTVRDYMGLSLTISDYRRLSGIISDYLVLSGTICD